MGQPTFQGLCYLETNHVALIMLMSGPDSIPGFHDRRRDLMMSILQASKVDGGGERLMEGPEARDNADELIPFDPSLKFDAVAPPTKLERSTDLQCFPLLGTTAIGY